MITYTIQPTALNYSLGVLEVLLTPEPPIDGYETISMSLNLEPELLSEINTLPDTEAQLNRLRAEIVKFNDSYQEIWNRQATVKADSIPPDLFNAIGQVFRAVTPEEADEVAAQYRAKTEAAAAVARAAVEAEAKATSTQTA